jgi:hypothetical protein
MSIIIPTLLAAADQIISLLVGLAVLVIWIIGQIAEARKQKPPLRPEPGQPPDRRARGDQADQLRSEVEEFLRQAAGKEREAAPPRRQAVVPPPAQARPPRKSSTVEVLIDDDPSALEVQMLEPPSRVSRGPAREAAVKNAPARSAREKPPDRPVHEIRERTFAERISHLGERVALADDQMSANVHAKFDHAVGRLSGAPIASAFQAPIAEIAPARQIADMLSSPTGVRQAIVLGEVLIRPEHRWD